MSLKDFIKENFVLTVGISLPVLLVVVFFVATVLPKSMAVPAQYEMLFSTTRYDYQNPPPYNVDFVVKNGALEARLTKNNKAPVPNGVQNYYWKKLMAYDGKTQSVREIPYNLSKLGDVADGSEIALDEFKGMKIDSSTKAPDGYQFNVPDYYSGGQAPELFWGGGYRNNYGGRVTKGAVSFKIPNSGSNEYYYNGSIQFIGWVIDKK